MARRPILYKDAIAFCRHHLGRDCFAPFTGQDWSGWMAFVYLVEMYGRSGDDGRQAAVEAMRAIFTGVQNKECIRQVFCQAIPAVLDWSDAPRIWARLHPMVNWDLRPVERRAS